MRRALRVQAAGLFIMRVRLCHKFGKRRVHMDIVRHKVVRRRAAAAKMHETPKAPVTVRTIMQKHVDRGKQLVVLDKTFNLAAQRHELRSQFVRNQSALRARFAPLDAV